MTLPLPKTGDALLEMYYHDMRHHLLEVAAAFDRMDRAGGCADARLDVLRRVARIAVDGEPDRARRFLEALSES
ncbi:MAG: hypothetical protein JXR77_16200 [Lentisphaeria bacterium]|nr:hypothetical protein [Lentisphaeria bacterium]